MKTKTFFWNVKIRWVVAFLLLNACVDRIYFDVPSSAQFQTVVEGFISDLPGPYTVNLSRGQSLDADSLVRFPVEKAKIKLYDDDGNEEDFAEASPGVYMTGGVLRGKVGHAYHITVETSDGRIFASLPDKINPVGEVEQINYEFEARTVKHFYGDTRADVFNIYVDAGAGTGGENYVRWRFKGTYKILTYPQLNWVWSEGFILMDPYPCSGYVVEPALGGGKLTQVEPCTCCTCWINQFEQEPQVSDGQFISGNQFKHVQIAKVPINSATFFDRYQVEVEQMSLSKQSFEFFKLIRAQKEGASSLFQPPSGEITGNISPVNSSEPVVGLFWATSVKSKSIFILRSEVPYKLAPIDTALVPCTRYSNSSTNKPDLWP